MSQSLDRLTLLDTFARIAERGSISAAARDLGLSQASASRQLATLERRLGVRLIARTTHDQALTEAGRACLAEARGLLAGWEALAERFEEGEGALQGRLRVIAPVALGQLALAEAAAAFVRAHPNVSLRWLLDDGVVRMAEEGADLWLRVGSVPDETLTVRPLGHIERLVAAAPELLADGAPAGPEALGALPAVAVEPFEGARVPLVNIEGRGELITARPAVSTDSIVAARAAARAGAGWAVLPRWFIEDDLAAGRLVDLLVAWRAPTLVLNAALLPATRRPRRLAAFVDHVADAVHAIPGIETT